MQTWNLELGTWNLRRTRRAFTLTELLIVITIITILSGLGLSAYTGATNLAREERTRAIINKIDTLIMERYEGYRTRAVPIKIGTNISPYDAAIIRLNGLRDLMRMEMPDRVTDLENGPAIIYQRGPPNPVSPIRLPAPSSFLGYQRRALRTAGASWATTWTPEHQGSECLYLILSRTMDGEKNALDYFAAEEIGDTDGDQMLEILDGWGRPIEFLRWAPGYCENPGPDGQWGVASSDDDGNTVVDDLAEMMFRGTDDFSPATSQTRNFLLAPDEFDPVKRDFRWTLAVPLKPYSLHPLIISSGQDGIFDVALRDTTLFPFRYALTIPPNDPYFGLNDAGQVMFGTPVDVDGDGLSADNITNHDQTSQ